jgi:ketosteroid isomerase-like protein
MPSRRYIRFLFAAVFAFVSFALIPTAKAQNDSPMSDQKQIVRAVNTVFAAVRADDSQELDSVVTPDFYIFDGGARFNADSLMTLMKAQHAAGKRYEWSVTDPDVHVSANTAWIAYINKGRISDAAGGADQQWLESAFLEKQAGIWKIVFMHSTRVPMASQLNGSK